MTAQCVKSDDSASNKRFLSKVHQDKVDNTSVPDKVFLRQQATKHLECLNVLDLYAGENVMWSHFKTDRYYGVEIVKGKGKNLNVDCRRVIDSLDLSNFNVIDCDSYGIPFDVMLKLFEIPTLQKGTVIIYAAISNRLSGVSKKYLEMFSLENMYKKSQVLIAAKSIDLFYAMLERQGVKVVYYYKVSDNFEKHYGYFIVN